MKIMMKSTCSNNKLWTGLTTKILDNVNLTQEVPILTRKKVD